MRLGALVSFAAILGVCAISCARSAEERQLDEMRETIDRVQEERDRADQAGLDVGAAEVHASGASTPAPPPAPPALPPASADSVRFGDEEETPSEADFDTEDTSPRPTIRVVGGPRPNGRGQAEQVFVADEEDAAGAASPRSSALDPEAKRAYDAALSLVATKQYDLALDALAAFLVRWPDHPYADNALYWRGECYFARGDYARASEQFDGVLARFPAGNKAPDALLKLGICQQKLGNTARANECFARLARQYKGTEAARHIPAAPPAAADAPARGPTPEVPR